MDISQGTDIAAARAFLANMAFPESFRPSSFPILIVYYFLCNFNYFCLKSLLNKVVLSINEIAGPLCRVVGIKWESNLAYQHKVPSNIIPISDSPYMQLVQLLQVHLLHNSKYIVITSSISFNQFNQQQPTSII